MPFPPIRPPRPEDAADLRECDRRLLLDGRGMVRPPEALAGLDGFTGRIASWLARPPEDGAMWVAEVDGRAVAEATLERSALPACRHVATFAVQVHPDHQGQGLGKALLDAAIAHARAIGVERLQLFVRSDNARAIGLYRSRGFVPETRRVRFLRLPDGRVVDDDVMVLHLAAPAAEKAWGLVVRGGDLLVLHHPLAGWQLPKGTIDPGEAPIDAARREVAEETGLDLPDPRPLAVWTQPSVAGLHRCHAFVLAAPPGTPDRWDHRATGSPDEDGLTFHLRFHPLGPDLVHAFHPYFQEAVVRLLAARDR